jgi:hypothetical protein
MLDTKEIFHTGFVVPSIEAAMRDLADVFELAWTPIEERDMPVIGPMGPMVASMRFVYSRDSAPRIELLEPVEGTVWEVPARPSSDVAAAHHIGVWCADFAATSRRFAERGYPRVLTFDDGSGEAVRFAYHQLPAGPLVELVDAERRAELEAWFEGAGYPATR